MGERFSTEAVAIRRVQYGDNDLILTFFSRDRGKLAAIAKSAKKSRRRFAGVLELFSALSIVCTTGRRGGMPVLQEASLVDPHAAIRSDISRTAYASYWVELVDKWMEDYQRQDQVYRLIRFALAELGGGERNPAELSILFQMKFLSLAGLAPNLTQCGGCRRPIGEMQEPLGFSMDRGGVMCRACRTPGEPIRPLAPGTLKLLHWIQAGDLATASRIRSDGAARSQALELLEAFLPFHMGKEPRSLSILREVRQPYGT
jgi:DNA repair protein RecO (recombination protein O)